MGREIGIRLADGTFYALLTEEIPGKRVLQLSPSGHGNSKVEISLFASVSGTMDDACLLKRLELSELSPFDEDSVPVEFSISLDDSNERKMTLFDETTGKTAEASCNLSVDPEPEGDGMEEIPEAAEVEEIEEAVEVEEIEELVEPEEVSKPRRKEKDVTPGSLAKVGCSHNHQADDDDADDADDLASKETATATETEPEPELPPTPSIEIADGDDDGDEDEDVKKAEVPQRPKIANLFKRKKNSVEEKNESPTEDFDGEIEDDEAVTVTEEVKVAKKSKVVNFFNKEKNKKSDSIKKLPEDEDKSPEALSVEEDKSKENTVETQLPSPEEVASPSDTTGTIAVAEVVNETVLQPETKPQRTRKRTPLKRKIILDEYNFVSAQRAKSNSIPIVISAVCAVISLVSLAIAFGFYRLSSEREILPGVATNAPDKDEVVNRLPVMEHAPVEEKIPDEIIQKQNEIVVLNEGTLLPQKPLHDNEGMEELRYKVIWGDTLWNIAAAHYKDPRKFRRIAEYNEIKNPDYIVAGKWIVIPPN